MRPETMVEPVFGSEIEDSRDKAIDMQSFGAMTGVDPYAVREIEQLMQFNSNGSNLKDSSTPINPRGSQNLL